MINVEIKDINGKSVSLGDKIQFFYEDELVPDAYVVDVLQTSDSICPVAYRENRNAVEIKAGLHRPLGGKYSEEFKILSRS